MAKSINDSRDASETSGKAANYVRGMGSIALAGTAILLTGGLLVWVMHTQPQFNKIFADFRSQPSALTRVVASPLFTWLVGLLFVLTGIKEWLLKSRRMKSAWNVVAILAAVFLGELYVAGMFSPLFVLMDKLSK